MTYLKWPTLGFIHSERFQRLSKEGFWIILGQAAAVVGSLVGVRILTELLSPAAYGVLALGMTLATLVNQTVLGPLSNGVTRLYAPAQEKGDLRGYFSAVRRLVLSATGIVVLVILLAGAGLLVAERTEWIAIMIAALIFAILSGYNAILNGIQNAARQRSIVALHQGMDPWARFLFASGLLLCLGCTSTVAMIGYALGAILVLGSQYLFFRKTIPGNISGMLKEKIWRKKMWNFSRPFTVFGIFTWAQLVSDRWALGLFATTQDVGMYAVLYQLGYYPISMISNMVGQFLGPIFYQRAGDASDSRRSDDVKNLNWRITEFALGMTGVIFLVALVFHAQVFRVFVAKEYVSVSYLLPWIMLASGLFAAGQMLTTNLMIQMKPHVMTTAKIFTALLGVALNFAGAYWFGTAGIVIAGVLFSAIYFFWMVALSKR